MAELGEAGWLLQPASGPAEPMGAAAAGDAQFRLFEAVARCLGRLAAEPARARGARRPALGRRAVAAAAGIPGPRPGRGAVALLGAYRDTEASPELHKIAGQAQQLALAGLAPDDVGAMARELAGTAPFRPRSPPSCGSAAAATRSSSGS